MSMERVPDASAPCPEIVLPAARVIVDIGGEGRHPEAVNVNPRRCKTSGPERGQPIPRLMIGRSDALPLPDQSVDTIIVERTPLSRRAIDEIRRVARPGATIILRHARAFGIDPHHLAKKTLRGICREGDCMIGQRHYQETVIRLETTTDRETHPSP